MSETARESSRVGSRFGPYVLKRLLGRGGMGEVYEAEHTTKEWTVALKLLSPEFSRDPVFRERLKREARTAGRLIEPHVVPIHDYGEIDGQLFVEMRLVEGTDLDSLLRRFGPLSPPRAVAIITQVAAALDAAHAGEVMHRDVKPANVLVTRDDFAYLVDFGIAAATTDEKLTQLGTAVGTWRYMAPERFSAAEVTYRADIYALACVLYECLTGAPPYRADSMSVLVAAHLQQPIPRPSADRPDIPAAFDEVIARGMAKKPQDRYPSAGDLARAAHQALSSPDQHHAATLLERSQESMLPAGAPTQAPTFIPTQPSPSTPSSTPPSYPNPASSGPPPHATPPQTPSWSPTSGPIPASGQPPAAPQYLQGGWAGQPQQAGGPQPTTAPRNRNTWLLLGVAALVVVTALGGLGVWLAVHRPKPPPPPPEPLSPDRLSSILLSAGEINGIMGASGMQPGDNYQEMSTSPPSLSNPDCLGALWGAESRTYSGSGYTGVNGVVMKEPGAHHDHWVNQAAVTFPSADKAQAFVKASANKWKACAGQVVTYTQDGATYRWTFLPLTGNSPTISQMDTQEDANGWACQRGLSAVSNVVIDVNACGIHITNEGSQITDKMGGKVKEA